MKIKLFIVFSLLLVLSNTDVKAQYGFNSKWHGEQYIPFENIPRTDYWYDGEQKIMYLVTNDDQNLYLHLRVMNQIAIRKIVDFGLTVWVDTRGKNKKKSGIVFPIERKKRASSLMKKEERKEGDRDPQNKKPRLENRFDIKLVNIDGKQRTELIPADKEGDINGQMAFNEMNELEYHLTVPFNRVGLLSLKERFVTFNIESGKLDVSGAPSGGGPQENGGSRSDGNPSRNGGGPPNGGGGSMGRGGGRPSGGPQGGNSEMQTAVKIKIKKVKLDEGKY